MSSIIVLDSSDEDEVPPKKANLKSAPDAGNYSSNTNTSILKTQNSKQRSIPSSITVTPRPLTGGAKTSNNNVTMQQPHMTSPMAATINQAITNIINQQEQRQSSTPPNKGQTGNLIQNQRKRKTPTPPQQQQQAMPRLAAKPFATMTNSSPAKAATTIAPLPPIMPMITGVHSMASAGATPPLQLMATPPHHNMAGFMGLNEQLMINPHLIPSHLPPNTTITAHPNLNPNQNNINNNFKIHLPLKPPVATTIPSPAASPASSAPKTPSPQLAASPQPQGRMSEKNSRRIKPTTVVKSSDDAWLQQRHKQSSQRGPISLTNDMIVEMLPPSSTESPKSSSSASSSRHHTPMTSPTATSKSQKSPDVIMVTPPQAHNNASRESGTILDLTHSPKKLNANEIVDLVDTPNKKQLNGEDLTTRKTNKSSTDTNSSTGKSPDSKPEKPPPKPPLEPEYEELIKVCREADPSPDMEKLIKSKLLKYYYEVHGDFVKSKSFRKSIRKVVATIKAEPDLVYYNLKTIVEELKVRRKAKVVEVVEVAEEHVPAPIIQIKEETAEIIPTTDVKKTPINATTSSSSTTAPTDAPGPSSSASISATASTSTGNKKLDEQIKKLNKALYVITKRIEVLDQADVDWDDDDSSFLQVERFKKRACQIYEKICDLTGESKNASRLVNKPIKFNETRIPQFNKCLQAFINRTKEFPDYYDVLRMLEHCNRTYNLGLVNFEIKNIAEDAFIKVGKRLQSRRKADLYETVTHYGGNAKDPAKTDPVLAAKLNENLKKHKKITDILEKFSRKQDMPDEEEEEKPENSQSTESNTQETENTPTEVKTEDENKPKTDTINETETPDKIKQEQELKKEVEIKKDIPMEIVDADDDDDDEDEDEEEENLEEHVEILANGDVSDNESDVDINETKEDENATKELIIDKINEIPNSDINTAMEECVEILDKTIESSTNNDNNTSMECIELIDKTSKTNDNNTSIECIEITDNSQEEFLEIDSIQKANKLDASIIQIDSQTESIYVNNNNIEETTTKTATTTNDIPEVMNVCLTPPPNGKLKDTPTQLNNTLSSTSSLMSPSSTSCTATIITTTTTTKADLKIVHVSSLDHHDNDTSLLINTNDDSSLCTDLTTTATTTNKSLEEIIISDEES